uniref:Uncharacterized protein n=1 Tax=viral metagenome TaxID=1070528 RepID=A0A6C0ECP8_9ZZZZ
MGYLTDVLFACPIGIFYYLFVLKMCEILTCDENYNNKIKKILIISFIAGICGFVLSNYLFGVGKKMENRAVRYGVIFGSAILTINTVLFNWELLDNDTKLFIIGFILLSIIVFAYKVNKYGLYESKEVEDE